MPEAKKPENENEPEVEEEVIEEPEKKQPEPQGKQGKTFNQEEVDRLIQQRLRREKEASKTTIDALTTDVTFYEEQFTKVIEAQTADWDEGMKDLFMAMPVKERLQKLADEDFMAKIHRKNIPPKTPKSDGKVQSGGFTVRNVV